MKHFIPYDTLNAEMIEFTLGQDRAGKTNIAMNYQPAGAQVAVVSAPAITMWPRCSGDGNFGTMWGPTDASKAKFTLDLTDNYINEAPNVEFTSFMQTMEKIDDRLLDFVTENQLKVLGRKNLTREEVKMLQIRSVRPKYDKVSGALNSHAINLSVSKFTWNGMGGKYARTISVCDHKGATVKDGVVGPGDVVAATIYANQVYTGVGGDKFGIHWAFQDVSVVCQRANLEMKAAVNAFVGQDWSYGQPYVTQVSELPFDASAQFQDAAIEAV